MIKNLATIENVSLGHPDRQTELIADKILDKLLAIDNKAKVAIEITGTGNNIAIGGEVNLHGHKVDLDVILAEAVSEVMEFAELTEFAKTVNIINIVKEQSPDIANLVEEDDGTVNAGDQGHMIGYALNAPEYNYLPEAYFLTTSILKLRDDIWHKKDTQLGKWLGGDAKTQMTWSPQTGKIHSIVVSTQHTEDADLPKLRELIRDEVLKPVLGDKWHDEIVLYINYAGQFVLGGIEADSSAVGRKLAITTAMGAIGGYLKNKDFEDENSIATLPFIAMSGGASCVDGDTEYMTELGEWHKLKDYNGGRVAQWTKEGYVEFVEPTRYINEPIGNTKMYQIKRNNNIDMMLTEDHEVVYYTSKGNLATKTVKDLIEQHNNSVTGFKGLFPVSYELPEGFGGKGVTLTDDEIRLQIAFSADGSIPKNGTSKPRVRIKNKVKIERLRMLLEKTGVEYTEVVYDKEPDYTYYRFYPPIMNKLLHEVFADANKEQLKIIAEEVVKWDGSEEENLYRTTIKEDADFIQAVFTAINGTATSISVDDRRGLVREVNGVEYTRKSINYEVRVLQHQAVGIKNRPDAEKIEIVEVSVDRKYCFTVPSGMLVLRRNNKVFVTHNCGKDPSKVDRTGHLMARYIAKNIVSQLGVEEAFVQLSYVIGFNQPTSVYIQGKGLTQKQNNSLAQQVCKQIDLSPSGIIERFNLDQPIYFETTKNGQFDDPTRPWEQLDLTFTLS